MKPICTILWLLLLSLPLFSQESTPLPDRIFTWEPFQDTAFWSKAHNCGEPQYLGGSRILFGVESHVRFPGTRSVQFYTNAAFEEVCNQNFSVERAEIHAKESYADLGVELGEPGSTVWIGWSEMYTHLDRNHPATLLQFLSGEGSPAVALNYYPDEGLSLRRSNYKVNEGEQIFSPEEFKVNIWYDFIVEMKYSYGQDGYIKVWAYPSGEKSPLDYRHDDPPRAFIPGPTLHNGIDVTPPQQDVPQRDLGPVRLRWGVYRWNSGDLKPEEINQDDWLMEKFLGPVRIKVGDNLGESGFNCVKPRWEPLDSDLNTPNYNSSLSGIQFLNVGGNQISSQGKFYRQDQGFFWFGASESVSVPQSLPLDRLYFSQREGEYFGANISVPSGSYAITLHFAELTKLHPGERIFKVIHNGRVIAHLDLVREVGYGKAYDLEIQEEVRDGLVHFAFEGIQGKAVLSGITIKKTAESPAPVVATDMSIPGMEPGALRINCGSHSTLSYGVIKFQADTFFVGGLSTATNLNAQISHTLWENLYKSQRVIRPNTDSLVYRIPVSPGPYALRLHFAALPILDSTQIIELTLNEQPLFLAPIDLTGSFDANRAVVVQQSAYVPDSILELKIKSAKGLASIAGIEIIPQRYFSLKSSTAGIPLENSLTRNSYDEIGTTSFHSPAPLIAFWPNPAQGSLNIQTKTTGILVLQSLAGKTLMNWEVNPGVQQINLADLQAGVYILHMPNKTEKPHRLVISP